MGIAALVIARRTWPAPRFEQAPRAFASAADAEYRHAEYLKDQLEESDIHSALLAIAERIVAAQRHIEESSDQQRADPMIRRELVDLCETAKALHQRAFFSLRTLRPNVKETTLEALWGVGAVAAEYRDSNAQQAVALLRKTAYIVVAAIGRNQHARSAPGSEP